ncbi:MAG: hypothetical protein GDA56_15355 [Hormoscilla sp. GM7CHS1pb]|nr:hypothetical protein [Hormoscilla sp. GM7CHS1pb]
MMVFVCRNIWENDANKLASLSLQDLIQELCQLYPSLEQLTASLDKVVKSLNKPKEYSLVANTIISHVSNLYPDPDAEDSTQLILTQPEDMMVPVDASAAQPPASWELCDTRRAYDPFDLRLEVMKCTNPLRAKILIFSTIEQIFTFNQEDWLTIKNQELDDLLLRLFQECTTIEQLQYKLCETAKCLRDPSESNQAAGAIIQALRPFYTQGQGLSNQTPEFNSNLAESMRRMVNSQQATAPMSATVIDEAQTGLMSATVIDDSDDDSTRQFLPS